MSRTPVIRSLQYQMVVKKGFLAIAPADLDQFRAWLADWSQARCEELIRWCEESIRQCAGCSTFVFDTTGRVKFCGARCRNRVLVRQYRARNPERYRTYQRELMRRRAREGKA